jgi:tRNA threonylcarbamoyladenosine modification (KEOPS) complex  Pcc1 subunit
MIKSEIKISGDKALLNACVVALEPEQQFKTERANYSLKKTKDLIITIEAQDITAFRAVINSITSLLGIVNQNWRKTQNG